MAKSKTPFFSLSSSGSIGNAFTTQKRAGETLLRVKPTPAYRFSLPIAYQRWLYQDYAYLWRQQTPATQAIYRSAGVVFHLTGFQYWMKYHLTNLPDFIAWYRLDGSGNVALFDYSKNGHPLTNFGTSKATGRIGDCRSFDALNDYMEDQHAETINIGSEFTISFYLWVNAHKARQGVVDKYISNLNRDWQFCLESNRVRFRPFDNPNMIADLATAVVATQTWLPVIATRLGNTYRLYLDASLQDSGAGIPPSYSNIRLGLGDWQRIVGRYLDGEIDDLRILNRAFSTDLVEIKRHAERRHPG